MATTILDSYKDQQSDHIWFARSKRLIAPADGTHGIIRIPKNAFIMEVWLNIITAYDTAGSNLTVGYIGNGGSENLNGFLTVDIAKPTEAGLKSSTHDALATFKGKYFSDGRGAVTVTTDDNGGTAGTFQVFVFFAQIY